MSKKRLLILFTGGTFGMQPKPEAPNKFAIVESSEQLIREWIFSQVPELHSFSADFKVLFNNDSCQFGTTEWRGITGAVMDAQKKYAGVVVLHGTDTLAYSSSAIALTLANRLKIPVVFTGAQRPLSLLRNDARSNLIESCEVAITAPKALQNRCLVVFNHNVFLGSRVRKTSATNFDAFESPCFPSLGELGAHVRWAKDAIGSLPTLGKPNLLIPTAKKNMRILSLRTTPEFPGLTSEMIRSMKLDGILLTVYPTGTAPTDQPGFAAFLKSAQATKTRVFFIVDQKGKTQDLQSYAASRIMAKYPGFQFGLDMTFEAAYVKALCIAAAGLPSRSFGIRSADEMSSG